jgi:hypothetical protein
MNASDRERMIRTEAELEAFLIGVILACIALVAWILHNAPVAERELIKRPVCETTMGF